MVNGRPTFNKKKMTSTYCQQTRPFASIICAALVGSSASAQCVADLISNGFVDGADLAVVLSAWGTAGGTSGADMNHDGDVNGSDNASNIEMLLVPSGTFLM